MMNKYNVEVFDNKVLIKGELTIEEVFDFLNFYERKGYTKVVPCDRETICLEAPSMQELKNSPSFFETFFEEEKAKNQDLQKENDLLRAQIKLHQLMRAINESSTTTS